MMADMMYVLQPQPRTGALDHGAGNPAGSVAIDETGQRDEHTAYTDRPRTSRAQRALKRDAMDTVLRGVHQAREAPIVVDSPTRLRSPRSWQSLHVSGVGARRRDPFRFTEASSLRTSRAKRPIKAVE